jgi:hypothetical protein
MLETLPAIRTDEAAKEFLAGVSKGMTRLQEIIDDMVSVIRVELANRELKLAPVSIRSIINSIKDEQAQAVQERQLTLTISMANDLPMVNGDSKQLHSALTRIVGNAVKYTPDSGQVTINARTVARDGQTYSEIVVADTGVGIDIDKQRLIFEKFSTAEDVMLHSTSKTQFMGGGIGLGLTIAKGVINSHGGQIWVESEGYNPDNPPGSKFFILLPAQ